MIRSLSNTRAAAWLLRYPVRAWIAPIAVTIFAGFLRFFRLGRPDSLVFDETYYVKQAHSLLALGYEGTWAEDSDTAFANGDFSGLGSDPDFVVHPPTGKWLIALGIRMFGAGNPFGWRFMAALAGTLTVLLLARAATRLFNSSLYGAAAGFLLAVDGLHLVHSRTALLDIFLTFFVIAAFTTLILDWDSRRAKPDPGWFRPWLVATGVLLGLACSVKWSGIYYVAAFGILAVIWECSRRLRFNDSRWLLRGLIRDGAAAFAQLIPTALLTYVLAWSGWLAQSGGYLRQWAVENPGQGPQWLPAALRSLWEYHARMWEFHVGLSTPHDYQASAWGWLLQLRPTSFFYDSEVACGAEACSSAVTSLGNPILWWAGTLALLLVFVMWFWWNDGRAGVILAGIAAGWIPWLLYPDRTVFTFYAVVFAPFMALALVYVIPLVGEVPPGVGVEVIRKRKRQSLWVLALVCGLALALALFFYPIWSAQSIMLEQWQSRMWLHAWI